MQWRAAVMACLIAGLAGREAAAQPREEPSVTDKETARGLVALGHERMASGEYVGAAEAYGEAHALMGVPTTALLFAKALAASGKLLEARDRFLEAARYPTADGEPAAFARARSDAEALHDELEPRIPKLRLEVSTTTGPLPHDVEPILSIDGHEYRGVAATVSRQVNPGSHDLAVSATGYRPVRRTVVAEQTKEKAVRVILVPETSSASPTPAPAPAFVEEPSESSAGVVLMGIGFSLGGAGLIAGAITGGLSLSAADEAKEICPTLENCPESARDPLDRALLLANVSNVGFAVGGAGLVLGIIGVVVATSDGDEPAEVAISLGPTSIGMTGRF